MKYTSRPKRRIPRRLFFITLIGGLLILVGIIGVRYVYNQNLKPVSSNQQVTPVTVKDGASVDGIAKDLESKKLIRSAWAFRLYVSSNEAQASMKAGSYEFAPSQSVADIVAQLTRGKVATNLVTILPGQRLDQVRKRLIQEGFAETDVDNALNPANYKDNPALVDKPAGATLEGYLYPDSYQRTSATTASDIITDSLEQMNKHLTPDLRSAFAKQGLSTYQGIILSSIVEKEVSKTADRQQVAQTFLKRLAGGMSLQSDVTAFYGAILAGQQPSTHYDSAYNTYNIKGLPPTPISNVSTSSLDAVAHPATTDWLYFVAGDDGNTYFSTNLQDHEAKVKQYCIKLCGQ
jgi:UPF0755 protein